MCLMHPSICPAYAGDICAQKVTGSSVFYLSPPSYDRFALSRQLFDFLTGLLTSKRDVTKGCKESSNIVPAHEDGVC